MRKVIPYLIFALMGIMGFASLFRTGGVLRRDNLSAIASLHRDPDKVRRSWNQESWDKLHAIDKATSPLDPLDSRYQPDVTFVDWQPHSSSGPDKPVTRWKGVFHQGNPTPKSYQGDLRTVRLTPDTPEVEINGEPVILRYFSHALPRPENLTEPLTDESDYWSTRLRVEFFTPDGYSVSPETVRAWVPEGKRKHIHTDSVNWHKPYSLSFFLEYPESLDVSFSFRGVYDPETYEHLSVGYSPNAEPGYLNISTSVTDTSSASAELVLDMLHGPVTTFSLEEPRPGSRLKTPLFTAVILGMGPGKYGITGVQDRNGNNELTLNVRVKSQESHSFFAFAFGPRDVNRRLEIEAVDAEGNTADVYVSGWSDNGAFANVEMPFDHIRSLKFHYRTNMTRVFIETPLHAIPKENMGIQDLFDARVPLFRVSSEGSFQQMLAEFVQLRYRNRSQTTLPESDFPMTFANMALREILVEYLKMRPDVDVYVDEGEMELVFDDGSRDPRFLDIVKGWFSFL
ncbi:MAG: hypothetical protein PF795_03350 [Kiritimatiellae bacterium]|jgi:hypothetical protein|nr:hypothetical protein [Kiritimatiellia bacterium]